MNLRFISITERSEGGDENKVFIDFNKFSIYLNG